MGSSAHHDALDDGSLPPPDDGRLSHVSCCASPSDCGHLQPSFAKGAICRPRRNCPARRRIRATTKGWQETAVQGYYLLQHRQPSTIASEAHYLSSSGALLGRVPLVDGE